MTDDETDAGEEPEINLTEEIRHRLCELMAANHGRLTPAAVVEDAKNAASPLHSCFEWDLEKAAYAHWIERARRLIRSVRIEVKTTESTIKVVRYIRDPQAETKDQGYVTLESLRSDEANARDAVLYELQRAEAALRRARNIAAVLDIQDAFAATVDALNALSVYVRSESPGKKGKPKPGRIEALRTQILLLLRSFGPKTAEAIAEKCKGETGEIIEALNHNWFERSGRKWSLSGEGFAAWERMEKPEGE